MLDEDDWDGFVKAHREITRTYIIADDLTVSNPARIRRAYELKAIDGFILKPNQVGTITEALAAHKFASEHGMFSVTSGRSGPVVGDVVMDLAVGLQIPFIKNGCPRSGVASRRCPCWWHSIVSISSIAYSASAGRKSQRGSARSVAKRSHACRISGQARIVPSKHPVT